MLSSSRGSLIGAMAGETSSQSNAAHLTKLDSACALGLVVRGWCCPGRELQWSTPHHY